MRSNGRRVRVSLRRDRAFAGNGGAVHQAALAVIVVDGVKDCDQVGEPGDEADARRLSVEPIP